jgi:hypothetical protein
MAPWHKQLEQYCWAGQSGQDSWDRTAGIGQQVEDSRDRTAKEDRWDSTARIGNRGGTTGMEQPW